MLAISRAMYRVHAATGVYQQALSIVQQRLLDTKQLQEEYKNVVIRDLSIEHTVEQSQKPENGPRNRYLNVLPYDYNGVRISGPGSGYINASSIACDEGGVQCNYIAAQGPISSTVEQFWRMCLEQVRAYACAWDVHGFHQGGGHNVSALALLPVQVWACCEWQECMYTFWSPCSADDMVMLSFTGLSCCGHADKLCGAWRSQVRPILSASYGRCADPANH